MSEKDAKAIHVKVKDMRAGDVLTPTMRRVVECYPSHVSRGKHVVRLDRNGDVRMSKFWSETMVWVFRA